MNTRLNFPTVPLSTERSAPVTRMARATLLATATVRTRAVFCFLAGVIASVGLPPVPITPLFILGLLIALGLTLANPKGLSFRQNMVLGGSYGAGFYLFSCFWIPEAFSRIVHASIDGPISPVLSVLIAGLSLLALVFLVGYLCLFSALAFAIAGAGKTLSQRLLRFALAWAFFEWLRVHFSFGVPLSLNATTLSWSPTLSQLASVGGIHLLSFVLTLATASLLLILIPERRKRAGLLAGALFSVLLVFGGLRILYFDMNPPTAAAEATTVQIIQPATTATGESPQQRLRNRLIALTNAQPANLTVWAYPDTLAPLQLRKFNRGAVDLQLDVSADNLHHVHDVAQIMSDLPQTKNLIFPAIREHPTKDRYFASAFLVTRPDPSSGLRSVSEQQKRDLFPYDVFAYDKRHLVPLLDVAPFWSFSEFFDRALSLATQSQSYTPSTYPSIVRLAGNARTSHIAMLTGNDALHPGETIIHGVRSDLIVHLWDSAHFNTYAREQIAAYARFRAIETSVPMLFASSHGGSRLWGGDGRLLAQLDTHDADVAVWEIPLSLTKSIYSWTGDSVFFLVWLLALGISILIFDASFLRSKTQTPEPEINADSASVKP